MHGSALVKPGRRPSLWRCVLHQLAATTILCQAHQLAFLLLACIGHCWAHELPARAFRQLCACTCRYMPKPLYSPVWCQNLENAARNTIDLAKEAGFAESFTPKTPADVFRAGTAAHSFLSELVGPACMPFPCHSGLFGRDGTCGRFLPACACWASHVADQSYQLQRLASVICNC